MSNVAQLIACHARVAHLTIGPTVNNAEQARRQQGKVEGQRKTAEPQIKTKGRTINLPSPHTKPMLHELVDKLLPQALSALREDQHSLPVDRV